MKRIVFAVGLAAIAGLFAVACNGDDGGGSPTPSPAAPSPVATATPKATAPAAAPTASATPTPAPSSGAGEIAYFDPEGADIWLVNADGSGQRKLTEGQCLQAAGPFWSRRGDKIACASGGTEEAPETKITVFDLEGRTLAQVERKAWLGGFAWSADDRHFVYAIAEGEARETARLSLVIGDAQSEATVLLEDAGDARWSPDGAQLAYLKAAGHELTIYDLATGQSRALGAELGPLAWALGGKALLVAANFQQQEIGAAYEANLLDVASGQMTRVPELDNGVQVWLSRGGRAAAFLSGAAQRAEGGATISILDLATRKVTAIEGAVIGYPSEGIPSDHIAFSPDGAYLYWVDVLATSGQEGLSGAIHRAKSNGSELTELGVLNATLFSFSPDRTKVLYSEGSALWVAGVDGNGARSLAEGVGVRWPPAAWRPLP